MFTHLHVHTQYSLLDGASKIPDLISHTKELGMNSIAITDHGVMYGAVEFYQEALKQGVKPIIGCEVYVVNGSRLEKADRERFHLILLAENNVGYHNLMKIVSAGQLEGFYYKPRVDKETLRNYSEGIICLSACIAGELPRLIINNNLAGARRVIEEFIDIFGKDNYFLEMQNHSLPEEMKTNRALKALAKEYDLKLVCTNDIHYVRREDAEAQDVLLCIQTTSTVDEPGRMRFPNDSFYLKSEVEMAELFPDCREALDNTQLIADRCNVTIEFGKYLIPDYPVPEGFTTESYLRYLCMEGMKTCYEQTTPQILERLDYELGIIHQMGYDAYFLIVWDFIHFCRKHGIPVGPGRGSAAGSVVAYLLGITKIDPLKYNLLFERFLNPERVSMPDIDTDFCTDKRGEVLKYVTEKYGLSRVAQIITYGTLQAKGAIKDVGKALGMTYAACDEIAKMIPKDLGITLKKALAQSVDFKQAYEERPEVKKLVDLAMKVEGMPRNYGTHAAGVIIAPSDLRAYVPLQLDANGQSIVTQYDMGKVEGLGLLKMDFLGLKTLTVIDFTLKMIKESTGLEIDIDKIPLDDKKTCDMLKRGDTFGVFQLESEGITKLLMDLAPESFEDLIPLVALYRPGPLGTGMAEDFIAGRHGQRTAEVLHELCEPILKDTYGVILYQEQVMQITSAVGGFSLGQADIMRRAMGKKKMEVMQANRSKFVEGALKEHNIDPERSGYIFDMLEHFAGYGFNKSHSVAYALVAYQTAYLKANYPVQFMAAFLNSVMDNQEKISWYIKVSRDAGINILPPDVNESAYAFNVHNNEAIRFGLGGIKNVGENAVREIARAREEKGPFVSLADFCNRVSMRIVNKRVIENLIRCGAMDSLAGKRSQKLVIMEPTVEAAAAYQKDVASGQLNLFGEDSDFEAAVEIPLPSIPEMALEDMLREEKTLIGFYVTGHPLDQYQSVLKKYMPLFQFKEENDFPNGKQVKVGGIISSCVIRTTKRGETMAILTLEDYSSNISVVVFPKAYRESLKALFQDNIVGVTGRLSIEDTEVKIIANQVQTLERPVEGEEEPMATLHLKIEAHLDNNLTHRKLGQILRKYSGITEVYLHFVGRKQVVKCKDDFCVNLKDPQLLVELEQLLGPRTSYIKK